MIAIEQHGLEQAVMYINNFSRVDRRRLLSAMAETVRMQTVRRFTSTKTSPTGEPWAPLKASTLAHNPRRTSRDILVDTGRLRNSISARVSGSTAEIGTNVFYGKFHQSGTRRMPARPFMGLSHQDLNELTRVAMAFVGTAIRS